jgi:hypothetical protein
MSGATFSTTLLLCVAAFTSTALAQLASTAQVAVGTPVRIETRSGQHQEALFVSPTDSSLNLRSDCRDECARPLIVPWRELAHVEVRIQHEPSVGRVVGYSLFGAASGFLAGIAVAGLVGTATDCGWDNGSCPALAALFAIPVEVAVGTGIGLVVGLRHHSTTWETVWPQGRQ